MNSWRLDLSEDKCTWRDGSEFWNGLQNTDSQESLTHPTRLACCELVSQRPIKKCCAAGYFLPPDQAFHLNCSCWWYFANRWCSTLSWLTQMNPRCSRGKFPPSSDQKTTIMRNHLWRQHIDSTADCSRFGRKSILITAESCSWSWPNALVKSWRPERVHAQIRTSHWSFVFSFLKKALNHYFLNFFIKFQTGCVHSVELQNFRESRAKLSLNQKML